MKKSYIKPSLEILNIHTEGIATDSLDAPLSANFKLSSDTSDKSWVCVSY